MKGLLRVSLLLAGALLSIAALGATPGGTRYKWRDAQGAVHFADTLPPEALQLGYDVVNGEGLVVRHVDRPKTPEERKAEALAAAEQAATKRRATEAAAADHQLLATYPNESDLARVHKDRLTAIDQTLSNINVSVADQEKGLSDQLAHAASFERDGKPVPAAVRQQIETLRKTIAEQHAFITRREAERAELIRKSDAEIAHYRELHAKQEQEQAARQ